MAHQAEVLDLVTKLNRERGTTVVIVLHELNLAARYGDHMIAMKSGRIVAQGAPAQVVTTDQVREVFGLESVIMPDPLTGAPMVIPQGRYHSLTLGSQPAGLVGEVAHRRGEHERV